MFSGLMALTAIHSIKNDFKIGDLRGFALQVLHIPTFIEKPIVSVPGASDAILTSQQEIKSAVSLLSARYGLDYEKFYKTIECESGFRPDPSGNLLSRGVAQFTLDTWLGNCSKTDERLNPYKSLVCMAELWENGQQYKWDCYCFKYYDEKCVKLRGLYPK